MGSGGGRVQEETEVKMVVEEMLSQGISGSAAIKLAQRLAVLNERQTAWDIGSPGIGLELCGDSLLITEWINGRWWVGSNTYKARVDEVIQKLEYLEENFRARPSSCGRDFCKHEYRESNARADELTRDARSGRVCCRT
ncbi:unnamed protein product [Prorocentrum cordatum]|uniref:RNase H type-1 domain-containing protein n=1 Tax=Prorocentrum cordatum TaxID=2364126 RepID=A0ABN9TZL5_9DINO|nr:unnamed protein product [Polarella glacialis]